VSKPAPESLEYQEAMDCRATAALLRSMRSLDWASHIAAILAISVFKWLPLVAWALVLYFSVRVRLDASLLEILAQDPKHAPANLDNWLSKAGLRTSSGERSIADRCKGARALARNLVCALLLQFLLTTLVVWGSKL
jgi:hypothetical protein